MGWSTPDVLRVLAASHLLALGALLLRDYRRDRSALASVFLVLSAASHTVQTLLATRGWPAPVVHAAVFGGALVPAAFWLLSKVHFDDECRICPWHGLSVVTLGLLGYGGWLAGHAPAAVAFLGPGAEVLRVGAPLLSLAVVAYALVQVYIGSRADLVVSRLRLRYWILGLTGGYVLVERSVRLLAEGTASETLVDALYAVTLYLLVFGVLLASTLVQPGVLKPSRAPAPEPEPAADPRLVEQLRHLVEVDQVFREEGLTIVALASRLGAHEYKVRQLVNAQMGFKNFNAFLHHYRLEEARRSLGDPAKRHLTVAQIAFEVGYASLGPFNRAFKEATGVTPTEFRAAHPADVERRVQPVEAAVVVGGQRPATG